MLRLSSISNSESVHTGVNIPFFTKHETYQISSRMRVIVWRRFNMLERRLRSVVTISLAKKDDNEEEIK